jgi:hypothetical protein
MIHYGECGPCCQGIITKSIDWVQAQDEWP